MERDAAFRVCPPNVLGYVWVVFRVEDAGKAMGGWGKSGGEMQGKNIYYLAARLSLHPLTIRAQVPQRGRVRRRPGGRGQHAVRMHGGRLRPGEPGLRG